MYVCVVTNILVNFFNYTLICGKNAFKWIRYANFFYQFVDRLLMSPYSVEDISRDACDKINPLTWSSKPRKRVEDIILSGNITCVLLKIYNNMAMSKIISVMSSKT